MIPAAPLIPLAIAGLSVGSVALSAMTKAIQKLYGVAGDVNDYLNNHIEAMKSSENPTISRTGRILEMAKYGFGVGYLSSVVIIAVGQLLLGNTFAAITTVATAATLTNPIAMTCAAFGAIYYGWGALSDVERDEILEKISKGLETGIELIKAIVRFVIEKSNELLSAKNIDEIKEFIGSAAAVFGRTLGDVTHKFTDVVSDTFDVVKKKSGKAMGKTIDIASDAYRTVSETAEKATDGIRGKLEKTSPKLLKAKDPQKGDATN